MPGYNYIDYAQIDDTAVEDRTKTKAINSRGKRKGPRGGVAIPFPKKLHDLLTHNLHSDIISWASHGRCFVVHKPNEFVKKVMPKYFSQSKLTSFHRQLNLYGFTRLLAKGPDKGGYFHEMFLRGKPNLSSNISRMRIKGPESRVTPDPKREPKFYSMLDPLPDTATRVQHPTSVSQHGETVASHAIDETSKTYTAREKKESTGLDERTKQFSRFYFPSCTSLFEEENILDEYPKGKENPVGSRITPNSSSHSSETSDNDHKHHFYDARKWESCPDSNGAEQNSDPALMNNSMELRPYIVQLEEGLEQIFKNTHDSLSKRFEMSGDFDLTKVFDH